MLPTGTSHICTIARQKEDDAGTIPYLIAVGAAAVSVFGVGYPGYSSHIGPALVFGYRAGRDIAPLAALRNA